jgi:diguanylate cyclase (GGDEF)-like protein
LESLDAKVSKMEKKIEAARPAKQLSSSAKISPDVVNREFLTTLMHNLQQGVVLLDNDFRVLVWNQSAEKITGVRSSRVIGKNWFETPIRFNIDQKAGTSPVQRPIRSCVESGQVIEARVLFEHPMDRYVSVEMRAVPMMLAHDPNVGPQQLGAMLILQDLSFENDLQRQVCKLHQQASLDPLTSVPNRTEFERALQDSFDRYKKDGGTSCLIICDIDFFKRINDDYGHQKGDLALVSFARHLQKHVRANDLVARYGGEEFVILCADCNQAHAMERAEKIRKDLERSALTELDGKCLTASFGVAEICESDTPSSLFVRADHALLSAKESGRNRVACSAEELAGVAKHENDTPPTELRWKRFRGEVLASEEFVTPAPPDVLFAKIRGFIDEQSARITRINPNHIALDFGEGRQSMFRRSADQSLELVVDIELSEEQASTEENRRRSRQTMLRITIRPKRRRDRRRQGLDDAAAHVLTTLRSYLMVSSTTENLPERAATRPGEGRE